MSKPKRNILITVSVILLLVIGIIFLLNFDADEQDNTKPADETVYTILSDKTEDISYVEVLSPNGTIKAENSDSGWSIANIDASETDSSKVYSLVATVSPLTSKNKLEETKDLAQYGLDKPQLTVNVRNKNGNISTLYVGILSPTLGEYFIMKDGDSSIYTIYAYKVDTLKQPIEFYKEFNRFNINIDDIYSIELKRSDETILLTLTENEDNNLFNVWKMSSPYDSSANDDYIDAKILEPIANISLVSPVDVTDGGFTSTSPILSLTVKPLDSATGKYKDTYKETLIIGKTEGENTYVKYKNNVFAIPSENIGFIYDSAFNFVSKLQALEDIAKITDVTIEYGDERHTMSVENRNHEFSFKLDGSNVNNSVSQKIYENLISLHVDAVYKNEPLGETVLKIKYNGIKNENDAEIEFRSIDDLNCALVRNGNTEFTIRKKKLAEFIEQFENYVKNPN